VELRDWDCRGSSLRVSAQLAQGQKGLAVAVAAGELAVMCGQTKAKTCCENLLQPGNGGG